MKRAAVLVLVVTLGGCSAFRASAGIALGIGGSAKVGPVDAGCLGGIDLSVGNYYGRTGPHIGIDMALPALARIEAVGYEKNEIRAGVSSLILLPFYPALAASDDEKAKEARAFFYARPWEISVSAYAVFLAFHLGFDPSEIVRPLARCVSLAAGGEDEDPEAAPGFEVTPPDDGLLEVPYQLQSRDDLAALDSGTVIEQARRWARFAGVMGDSRSLIEIDSETVTGFAFDRWVAPHAALDRAPIKQATRERVAALRAHETAEAVERAAESRDPHMIGELLARCPLAPREDVVALERRRGELLVERGALEQAEWAFAKALDRIEAPGELDAANARLATVRRLRETAEARPVARNAHAGSADLGGMYLGASGTAVWCLSASGDVAWERSDALPGGFCASKVVGVVSDLAIVEAQAPTGRPWLIALEFTGRVAWMTPLPAALPNGSAMDQFYVLGLDRVFVGRMDRVIALEAPTGRVAWMTCRKDPAFTYTPRSPIVPLDWRPAPGAPKRRPDGEAGYQIRLGSNVLEVRTSRAAPIFRFDPRDGRPLDGDAQLF